MKNNKFSGRLNFFFEKKERKVCVVNATPKSEHYKNNNRQKAILTGLSIFQGEGVAAHLGHQACR